MRCEEPLSELKSISSACLVHKGCEVTPGTRAVKYVWRTWILRSDTTESR